MSIPQKYDNEFKTNAVRLALSSNKSHREIADELGVGQSTLSKWVRNYRLGRTNNLATVLSLSAQDCIKRKPLYLHGYRPPQGCVERWW